MTVEVIFTTTHLTSEPTALRAFQNTTATERRISKLSSTVLVRFEPRLSGWRAGA